MVNKTTKICLIVLICFTAVSLQAQDDQTLRFAEIEGLVTDGLDEQAIVKIEEFLRDFPGSPNAEPLMYRLGELQFKTERFGAASKSFERFIREHPASPDVGQARFLLASAYRLTERTSLAGDQLSILLRTRRLDERLRIAALERRADIAIQTGDLGAAMKDMEDLVRREKTPQRQFRLATIYFDLSRFRQAERLYSSLRASTALEPEDRRTATLQLALIHYRNKKYRRLVDLLQPLEDAYRDDDAMMMTLAWAYYQMKNYQAAFEIVSDRPPDERLLQAAVIRDGRSLLMLHEYEAAINYFQRVINEDKRRPVLAPAHRYLAEAFFAVGDVVHGAGTLEKMTEFLDDDEEKHDVWVEIGGIYASRLDDNVSAIAAYRKALAFGSSLGESDEIQVEVARAQIASGDVAGAGSTFIGFFEQHPHSRFTEEMLFMAAGLYERSGDFDRALEHYLKIARIRGDSPFRMQAYESALELAAKLRRWDDVLETGEEFILEFQQRAQTSSTHLALAKAYFQKQKFTDGISHYELAITTLDEGESSSSMLLEIGWGYYKLGDFERATDYYSRVISEHQESPEVEKALYWLGWLSQVGSDLTNATDYFEELLRLYPSSRYAEISLWQVANNHLRRGDLNLAVNTLTRLIDHFPDGQYSSLARQKLIDSLVKVGNYRAALDSIGFFTDADPSQQVSPAALLARGNSLAQAGKMDAALKSFRLLQERFPASEVTDESILNAGIILFRQEKYRGAANELGKVAEFFPDSEKIPAAAYYLGQSFMALRQYSSAVQQFKAILDSERGGDSAGIIHYLIGFCYEQLSEDENAMASYSRFLDGLESPQDQLQRRIKIAEVFFRNEHFDEAIVQLNTIVTAAGDPEMIVNAQFAVASIYELKGDLAQAAMEYLKVTYVLSPSPAAALMARMQAGRVFESLGRWQDAVNVYQTIVDNHADTKFGEVAAIRIKALRKRIAAEEASPDESQSDIGSDDGTSPVHMP